jgi:hypothetical protein
MNDFFERYADRIGKPTKRGCRVWKGARNRGYGWLHRDGVNWIASRAAFECVHGAGSAVGRLITHSCDNRPCVEPSHLIRGTYKTNSDDKYARNRAVHHRGEKHGRARLTHKDVAAIRKALARGAYGTHLARSYGVHHNTVYQIKNNKNWRRPCVS